MKKKNKKKIIEISLKSFKISDVKKTNYLNWLRDKDVVKFLYRKELLTTIKEKEIYNPSATRLSDVIHTNLAVSFNWEKQHLLGHAELTISPYFYSTNELILDAKGFDIHLINMNGKELSFEYDSLQLFIQLDREYQRDEKYTINIDYTAKPNDLKIEGLSLIHI